ncbi:MAG TPA: Grx4 family monothiol glutaredoxin [Candidatus Binataceae bacterium]|nr:Grx4 family monothiol glutaredoxin [Candidatus Binataceae bacterium]
MSNAIERIQSALNENKICLFMKGNRNFPQCGFSAATVAVLDQLGVPYGTVDVLSDPELRDQIKVHSNWPTIPQLYIEGKFVGGCDIVRELYENGELQSLIKPAAGAAASK